MTPAPIEPEVRRCCMKCTARVPLINGWCDTCRFLLTNPDTNASYSRIVPPRATLQELGLLPPMVVRSRLELIPEVLHVEEWPEVDGRTQELLEVEGDEIIEVSPVTLN